MNQGSLHAVVEAPVLPCGNTPMIQRHFQIRGQRRAVWLKLESYNPAGSLKDRTAAALISNLETRGLLNSSTTVLESTSGNLGVALAYFCRAKGYRFLAVIDPKTTPEICSRMQELGAELDLVTDVDENGGYLISRLRRIDDLCKSSPNYVWTNQYGNPANPLSHYLSTGPEIYHQSRGELDAVFIPVSTGGTLAGVGRYLREVKPAAKVLGVDAAGSVIFGTPSGKRKLTGIGSSRKSDFLKPEIYDGHLIVTDQEAFSMCRRLAEAGIHVGGSSGATIAACIRHLATHPEITNPVCICPDSSQSYLSTIFSDAWLFQNGFTPASQLDFLEDIKS